MNDANAFTKALLGKPVSHVWCGYGSALFVEFGKLTPTKNRAGKPSHPKGEITLMIEMGLENRTSKILGGCWSSERRWPSMFKRLIGGKVTGVETFGALPEISVSLSNGLRVVSFMVAEGQPQWALIARQPRLGNLCVKRGNLYIETARS